MELWGALAAFVGLAFGVWGLAEQNVWIVGDGTVPAWLIPVDITECAVLLVLFFVVATLIGDL